MVTGEWMREKNRWKCGEYRTQANIDGSNNSKNCKKIRNKIMWNTQCWDSKKENFLHFLKIARNILLVLRLTHKHAHHLSLSPFDYPFPIFSTISMQNDGIGARKNHAIKLNLFRKYNIRNEIKCKCQCYIPGNLGK